MSLLQHQMKVTGHFLCFFTLTDPATLPSSFQRNTRPQKVKMLNDLCVKSEVDICNSCSFYVAFIILPKKGIGM